MNLNNDLATCAIGGSVFFSLLSRSVYRTERLPPVYMRGVCGAQSTKSARIHYKVEGKWTGARARNAFESSFKDGEALVWIASLARKTSAESVLCEMSKIVIFSVTRCSSTDYTSFVEYV